MPAVAEIWCKVWVTPAMRPRGCALRAAIQVGAPAAMGEQDAGMDDGPGALPRPMRGVSARTQVSVAGAVGVAVGVAVSILAGARFGALVAWDAATALYMAWVWLKVWPLDSEHTRGAAEYEDPTRAGADLILLGAAVRLPHEVRPAGVVAHERRVDRAGLPADERAAVGVGPDGLGAETTATHSGPPRRRAV
jgi:hypothetical protein